MPYQELSLRAFGKLPAINTVTKDNPILDSLTLRVDNPEEFRQQHKRKQKTSPKKLPIQKIHSNLTKFLNGFEWESEEELKSESEGELESEPEEDMEPSGHESNAVGTTENVIEPKNDDVRVLTSL